MSLRGLLPLALGGGLAFWAYKKNEEGEASPKEDLDLDPIEEIMREKEARAAAEKAEKEKAAKESAG